MESVGEELKGSNKINYREKNLVNFYLLRITSKDSKKRSNVKSNKKYS